MTLIPEQLGHHDVEGAVFWHIDEKFLLTALFISQKIKMLVPGENCVPLQYKERIEKTVMNSRIHSL